jgi:hypothetical protein
MTNCRPAAARLVTLLVPGILACGGAEGTAMTEASTTAPATMSAGTGTEATSATGPTAPTTSEATTEATPTTGEPPLPDLPVGGECDLFVQDCGEGTKCNAWSMMGGIFPDGAKCVPVGDKLPGEDCTIEGGFGDGIDDCVAGSICLDIDNSGGATCVAYCSGSMDAPQCPDEGSRCSFLFEPTVPLCFTNCDPLVQNCSGGETCVPNIAALGAEFFVCMPRVFEEIPGQYGDACAALSGCDPSYLCIFAENVPGCTTDYCCSTYCELDDPGTCAAFDPLLACVPWFGEGQATPGYENVGICGIMP